MFGGGIVILPLLEREAVEKKGWITSEELVEYYSISQLIPGLNAPDVSMFIGYKLRGKLGALVAGVGVIFVPTILIICLAAVLGIVSSKPLVKSALWGVEIGTIIILATALRTMLKRSIIDKFSLMFFLLVFVVTVFNILSPSVVVIFALLIGIFIGFQKRNEGNL